MINFNYLPSYIDEEDIKRICAWCRRLVAGDPNALYVSHCMCKDCGANALAQEGLV